MIIGVTGYLGAGKDTVAHYLVKKGFTHISLSDILREDLRKTNKQVTRKNLQELGAKMRGLLGDDILAERCMARFRPGERYVVSSIGTVGEVQRLQHHPQFVLVFVDASLKRRFVRVKQRKREEDPATFASFKHHENKENKGGEGLREFSKTKKLANIILNNNATKEQLYRKIDHMLADLKKKPAFKRPGWDNYFLGIMDKVAKRGTCDRGQNGCVIVKDKRILCTGYVGSPMGLPHCDEEGHLLHKVLNTDGSTSVHCIRTVHAEQNAIAQAARNGISIQGATMYTKMEPCRTCAMMIINTGIVRVVAKRRYHRAQDTREMFKQAGILLDVVEETLETYENM